MFKNKNVSFQTDNRKLFEDICLILLENHFQNPRRISDSEMFDVCGKAEKLTKIIKTWELESKGEQ